VIRGLCKLTWHNLCCSQCVAVRCSMLQCTWQSRYEDCASWLDITCVAVSVLQCVTVCCSMLQCVAVSVLQSVWQVNLTRYNLSSDLKRGKRLRRESTCQVNSSIWRLCQVHCNILQRTATHWLQHKLCQVNLHNPRIDFVKCNMSPETRHPLELVTHENNLPASASNLFFRIAIASEKVFTRIFGTFFCV